MQKALGISGFGIASQQAVEILRRYQSFFRSPQARLTAIKKGLEASAINDLLDLTGATQMDVAQILDLTEPTLRKYIKEGKELNTGLSEHILQLFELFDKGMDTFGSLEEFKRWLPRHNIGIGASPIELLDTITGINIVLNELMRIDYGALA
jgi:putative toxin-antitoxin system antitoxin component (TIGR02293 family)